MPTKFFFLFSLFILAPFSFGAAQNCACPPVTCNSCQIEDGVEFYTEKCGADGQVKSCARPVCVDKNEEEFCLVEEKPEAVQFVRQPASTRVKVERTPQEAFTEPLPVGHVSALSGKAWALKKNGERFEVQKGHPIFAGQKVETGKKTKLTVKFVDGNILRLMKKTKVRVSRYLSTPKSKQMLVSLSTGQLRAQSKMSFDNKENYYRIKTPNAEAALLGTDFIVNYHEGEDVATKVTTIKGSAKLISKDRKHRVIVGESRQAKYIVKTQQSVFTDREIQEFVKRGYMTPAKKLSAEALRREIASTSEAMGSVASAEHVEAYICQGPPGRYNQCLWQCRGNPKGQKNCRTDLPSVQCVRTRCNANGQWKEPERMPASFRDLCEPQKLRIGSCDY